MHDFEAGMSSILDNTDLLLGLSQLQIDMPCSGSRGKRPDKITFVKEKLLGGVWTMMPPPPGPSFDSFPFHETLSFTSIPLRINPLFDETQLHLRRCSKTASARDEVWFMLNYTIRDLRSEASWRRTHISDPPCRTLGASIQFETNANPKHSVTGAIKLDSKEGLTFGDIVDLVIERGVKREHNGKRCRDSEVGILAEEIRHLESHDDRDACTPS